MEKRILKKVTTKYCRNQLQMKYETNETVRIVVYEFQKKYIKKLIIEQHKQAYDQLITSEI